MEEGLFFSILVTKFRFFFFFFFFEIFEAGFSVLLGIDGLVCLISSCLISFPRRGILEDF